MNPADDPRFMAAVDMVGRTGATQWQVRYSDEEKPVIWMAAALYDDGRWECAAGRDPAEAALRLCAQLIDGGLCRHCNRPTGFDADFGQMPLADHVCWYQFDPKTERFQRGCVGRTS